MAKGRTISAKKQLTPRGVNARAAVSNGRLLPRQLDGRTVWGRRFYDLVAQHVADLGGVEMLSEAQLGLVRRVATLEVSLEGLEADMAEGNAVDLDAYARAAGHCRRIVETLGLRRVAKDVTPSLHEIIAKHNEASRKAEKTPTEAAE